MARLSDRSVVQARAIVARAFGCSLAAGLIGLTLGACGAAARGSAGTSSSLAATASRPPSTVAAQAPAEAPCAAGAPAAVAQAAGLVAMHIYELELASPEVRADQRQVEAYGPLLSALAAGDRAAVSEAVTSLVYSHTHVVRLRVTRGATVLADVGGPFILAPVGGPLRAGGRTVGRYLLSVQDDSGFVKLEQRYVGDALLMRIGSRVLPVEGALGPAAGALPERGPASYHGAGYEIYTLDTVAFPSGTLKISLLVPQPGASTAGCRALAVSELDRVGERIWRRFALVSAPPSAFVHSVSSLTGALAYVRSGARQIAGSTQPGPPRLPVSGNVRYHGLTYDVCSFAASTPSGPVRVYQLLGP
ncbi:MAG TPA: hypothetical protein VN772_01870 [Solirubrobacteraceae bacterium]|nr:hypothetical protein [Solirubrobacteraceae bacterium]